MMSTYVIKEIYRFLGVVIVLAVIGASLGSMTAKAAVINLDDSSVPVVQGIYLPSVQASQSGSPAITSPWPGSEMTVQQRGGNLSYHGGPVQKNPEVYVLFWGSWWWSTCLDQQGLGNTDEAYLYHLYNGLGSTSDYLSPVTSQYYGPVGNNPTFPTMAGGAFITWNADCTDPPLSTTETQLTSEVVSYASYLASKGYSMDDNTQIVIVSPSGINAGGGFGAIYCSYHNWAQYSPKKLLSWTNLPYIPDAGSKCGANMLQNRNDGWSIVAGHEYMESVTDPFVGNQGAWYDSQGSEIGDKCIWKKMFLEKMATGSFAMQSEWDNITSSCQDSAVHLNGSG